MALAGTWTIDTAKSENGIQFLIDTGVPEEIAQKMDPSKASTKIEDLGNGRFRATVSGEGLPEKSSEFSFGEQVDVETPFGLKLKTTIVDDGNNKYTETSIDEQGREIITVRNIEGNVCNATTTIGDKTLKFVMTKS